MSKFGDLIDVNIPVLFDFYTHEANESSVNNSELIEVAASMGDAAKIIKINIEKNQELCKALKIRVAPTFIIYKNGEMVWRYTGAQDSKLLTDTLREFV